MDKSRIDLLIFDLLAHPDKEILMHFRTEKESKQFFRDVEERLKDLKLIQILNELETK